MVEAVGVVDRRGRARARRGPRHAPPRLLAPLPHAVPRQRRARTFASTCSTRSRSSSSALHLAGFFWGDCSLSNTLFRRDAGALSAYLVDAETGELHPTLTDGQRRHDLLVARENLAGELLDLGGAGELPHGIDPIETAEAVRDATSGSGRS